MRKSLLFLIFIANVFANNFMDIFNQSLDLTPSIKYDNSMSIDDINIRNFSINNCELRVNEEFYIVREFDDKIVIIAKAEVLSKQDDKCSAKLLDKYNLEQKSMPSIRQNLKTTDKILKDISYKRALVISPNNSLYEQTLSQEYIYIHPDVFIGFLAYDNNNKPKAKDFKKFCLLNDIGTLNIVLKNSTYVLDCRSFKILDILKMENNNLDENQNSIYASIFYKLKIKYNEYFLGLIKENNKEYFKKDK